MSLLVLVILFLTLICPRLRRKMICLMRKRSSGTRTRWSAGCATSSTNKTPRSRCWIWFMNELLKSCQAGQCMLLVWVCKLYLKKLIIQILLCVCLQLQVVVQLPEREEEADKRKMRHGSGVRGSQQLPRESAGVHAQGETRAKCSSVKLMLIRWCNLKL